MMEVTGAAGAPALPEAYAAVLEAVQNGTISEERLDRSVNKILLYKQQFAS